MSSIELTPQERLAISRKAIVRHMKRDKEPEDDHVHAGDSSYQDSARSAIASAWNVVKTTVTNWWHYHPAHVALDLARPAFNKYAEEQPLKLLAVAAGLGAVSVVLRPWRLISLGGVALTALKSSEFSGLLLSMITRAGSRSSTSNPV